MQDHTTPHTLNFSIPAEVFAAASLNGLQVTISLPPSSSTSGESLRTRPQDDVDAPLLPFPEFSEPTPVAGVTPAAVVSSEPTRTRTFYISVEAFRVLKEVRERTGMTSAKALVHAVNLPTETLQNLIASRRREYWARQPGGDMGKLRLLPAERPVRESKKPHPVAAKPTDSEYDFICGKVPVSGAKDLRELLETCLAALAKAMELN